MVLVKENSTHLAELGTRSLGSQTSIHTTDIGTLQQWRSTHGAYRVELQRLQHRIDLLTGHVGKDEPGTPERQSTDDLQSLQARIRSITCDMDALRSSSALTAVGFLPAGHHSNPQSCSLCSAGKQAAPIKITASPDKPVTKKRTSPLAFAAASRFRASRMSF